MKNITFTLLLVFITSCSKNDTINHYLNHKVTEQELINNGFYKYSYTDTYLNDENEKDSLNGKVYNYVLYSNVKPQIQEDGKLYPLPLFGYKSNINKEIIDYIVNDLDDRIISYIFINDILDFKSIYVYSVDKNKKDIANFTTEKGILDYYKKQKVPFKQKLGGIKYGEIEFPYRFRINNYKTGIYILNYGNSISYQMVTNYETVKENEKTIYDFRHINTDGIESWYSGHTYELSK